MEEQLLQSEGMTKKYKLSFPGTNIADITNDRIYDKYGIEIVSVICDDDNIVFGKCNSDKFSVTVSGLAEDIVGKEMVVSTICGDVEQPLGKFIVTKAPKKRDKTYKQIVAYDRMQYLKNNMAHWYNTVLPNADSTVTLRQFRDSFFAYLGLPQVETTLINDDLLVRKTVDTNLISGIEIMQAVCEINGVFGHFNNLGEFCYVKIHNGMLTLYPTDDIYPGGMDVTVGDYITTDYESYSVAGINQLQIRNEEGDIGRIEPQEEVPDANAYIVSSNFLCYGMTDAELEVVAKRLLEAIKGIVYTPAITELPGMPYMELGTVYQIVTNEETVTSIVLKHTLSGGQALRSVFEASGEQYREEDIDGLNYKFEQLRGRYNKLVRTVDETISELGAIDKELGEVSTIAKQTASYFETTVTQEGKTLSRFTQILGKFLFEGESFAINTDNIKIDGPVLEIDNGYIGGIKIGSEGLSSEDYETLQIFKDGTGKFTNLTGEGQGHVDLTTHHPTDAEKDEESFFRTRDGFHADYDTNYNVSAGMYVDENGNAVFGRTLGMLESRSNTDNKSVIVFEEDRAKLVDQDGNLLPFDCKNMGGGGIGVFMKSDNYSFEEKVVGRWVDGKPLYQKTIHQPGYMQTGTSLISTGVGNVENCIEYRGIAYDPVNNCSISFPAVSIFNLNYGLELDLKFGSDGILYLQPSIDTVSYGTERLKDAYFTIRYTKTTDTPGEDLPGYIHYSTDERVVGTWIDGSVLYQKTLNLDGTFKSISFEDAGIGECKDIVYIEATWGIGRNGETVSTIWTTEDGSVYLDTNTRIINLAGRRTDHWTHYLKLTVRYTKNQ